MLPDSLTDIRFRYFENEDWMFGQKCDANIAYSILENNASINIVMCNFIT